MKAALKFIDEDIIGDRLDFELGDEETLEALISMTRKQILRVEQELLLEDENKAQKEADKKAAAAASAAAAEASAGNTASKGATAGGEVSSTSSADSSAPAAKASSGTGKDAADREAAVEYDEWAPPRLSVPICCDVRNLPVDKLRDTMLSTTGQLFDVIHMDPPWQLATANPTRGVALGYSQLCDTDIKNLPVQKLQTDGFLFMWVINAKYRLALKLLDLWGYELIDEVVWVKQTVNRRLAKSHGYYLQHAKETCLVAKKGKPLASLNPQCSTGGVGSDVIWSERRGQSQKPEEIYTLIENLVPRGYYLEIFGRRNNLHDYWVTIGNEL